MEVNKVRRFDLEVFSFVRTSEFHFFSLLKVNKIDPLLLIFIHFSLYKASFKVTSFPENTIN